MQEKFYDVIIFGASGYTGKYVIREGVKILKNLRWAVAGRNIQKLNETLRGIGDKINVDLSKIPIIIADVKDELSLINMTAQSKVIINCCGPYRFYGEQVVKACIETGTSHVDVSGEPQYMETMQLKYNDAAREKQIIIVSACGYDSIPADLGTIFLQKNFNGTLNSIETFLRPHFKNNYTPSGPGVNFTTYESAVYGFAHASEIGAVRKQLFKNRVPQFAPKLPPQSTLHKSAEAYNRWCLSVPTADHSVILRSQKFFYENENQRPIKVRTYQTYDTLFNAFKVIIAGILLKIMTKYQCGVNALLKYPELFSFGFTSVEGPTEERNDNTDFELMFIGDGWKEIFEDTLRDINYPLNKRMITRVICNNPLYGSAAKAVLLAAETIINEYNSIPKGVISPAAAFKNTNYIEKLQKHGFIFEIVKVDELKSKL
jgi:short subunit dehydrogenase-like uncharacterized protein